MKKCAYFIQGIILLFSSVYSYAESSSLLAKQEKNICDKYAVLIENLVKTRDGLPIRLMSRSSDDQKKYGVKGHYNATKRKYSYGNAPEKYYPFGFDDTIVLKYKEKACIDFNRDYGYNSAYQRIIIGETLAEKGAHIQMMMYSSTDKLMPVIFVRTSSRYSERHETKGNYMIQSQTQRHVQIKPKTTKYICNPAMSIKNFAKHTVSFRLMHRSGNDKKKYYPGGHDNIAKRKYWRPTSADDVNEIDWNESIDIPAQGEVCVSFNKNLSTEWEQGAHQDIIFDEPSRLGDRKGLVTRFKISEGRFDNQVPSIYSVDSTPQRIALEKKDIAHLEIHPRDYFECDYIQVKNHSKHDIPFRLMKKDEGQRYDRREPGFNNINYPQFWTVDQRSYKGIATQYDTTQKIPAQKRICLNFQLDNFLLAKGHAYFVFGDDSNSNSARGAIARIRKHYNDLMKLSGADINHSRNLSPRVQVTVTPKTRTINLFVIHPQM